MANAYQSLIDRLRDPKTELCDCPLEKNEIGICPFSHLMSETYEECFRKGNFSGFNELINELRNAFIERYSYMCSPDEAKGYADRDMIVLGKLAEGYMEEGPCPDWVNLNLEKNKSLIWFTRRDFYFSFNII